MANQNNPKDNNTPTLKTLNALEKLPTPVLVTAGGYQPIVAMYFLPVDAFINDLLEISRRYVPDFENCTILRETVRGEMNDDVDIPVGYLWVNANSPSILQDVGKDDTNLLPIKITEYSPKMKDFMKKYGYGNVEKQERIRLKEAANYPHLRAVEVDIIKVLNALFDLHGDKYQKEYGVKPVDVDITYSPVWNKRDPNTLDGFTIRKSLKNKSSGGAPIPKRNKFKNFK